MQKLKQTIILSGNGNEMATLLLEKKNGNSVGTLKVYNAKFNEDLMLGISCNGSEVLKQEVSFKNGNICNFKLKKLDSFDNVSCVLVKISNNEIIPILWGKKNDYKDKILQEFNECYIEKEESEKSKLFETNDEEIEKLIDKEMLNFDEEIKTQSNEIEENLEETTNTFNEEENDEIDDDMENVFKRENEKLKDFDGSEFFNLIAEQVDDLFETYPREDDLENLIPNSKWVKIDFENDGNEYVLGLMYDDFNLKYICYGLPGEYNSEPPKNLGECQWLPKDPKNPIDGYWVIYQDANTGEKVDVI